MRELIISKIKNSGWLDCWGRDDNAFALLRPKGFATYEDWLKSLDDEDVLAAYVRVHEAEQQLD